METEIEDVGQDVEPPDLRVIGSPVNAPAPPSTDEPVNTEEIIIEIDDDD